ncbi:MAG TPA: response regulator transcription factor [Solirubrobacteraceae bacterium]|jgi:DNA-binding NarL/FixJ family response regulator|nr:response regulator transcription factor [Solirubrobacteraceae bacterium]
MKSEELEVIVVDDHLAMRRGIELLLREAGFRIAGVAGTLDEARAILARRRFDVALLDVQLGSESSVGLVEDLLREDPTSPIVLYTGYTGSDSMLHEAVRAGARGFVLKTSPAPRLTDALRAVATGGTYVDPELAGRLAEDGEMQRLSALSARELEVLGLLADGLNGQMIAERLFLSPETVRTHVRNATSKMGARTRVQAVAMVVRGRRPG